MDEILIEDKRYISSKQAAKLTGYAKDYVGQLCREGRVPARLVGRSWYVLESAIQDHRFGNPAVEPQETVSEPASATLSLNHEALRYVNSPIDEVLPTINQLKISAEETQHAPVEIPDTIEPLQESWRSWFDRVILEPVAEPEPVLVEEQQEEESVDVNVPVRAIHHSIYKPGAEEYLPRISKKEAPLLREDRKDLAPIKVKMPQRRLMGAIQITSIMFALVSVIIAVMGSGYFDTYLISYRQVTSVSGVSIYNK